jgi:hypothetical protein
MAAEDGGRGVRDCLDALFMVDVDDDVDDDDDMDGSVTFTTYIHSSSLAIGGWSFAMYRPKICSDWSLVAT